MKRKKFDIQFTFNRLPVQMEHRACDRITRTEMRHVLFPREDVIHQRAEMNKHVGSVHSHKKIKENFVTFPVKSFLINFKKISAVVSLTILCFHTKLWRSLNSKKRGREVRGGGVREASTLRLPSASPPPPPPPCSTLTVAFRLLVHWIGHFDVEGEKGPMLCQIAPWDCFGALSLLSLDVTNLHRKVGHSPTVQFNTTSSQSEAKMADVQVKYEKT